MVAIEIVEMLKRAEKANISGDETKLLTAIMFRVNVNNCCQTTNEEFSKIMSVSVPSITRWLSQLAKKELITITINPRRHVRNIYPQIRKKRQKRVWDDEADMSEKQLKFKKAFPKKIIDCEVKDEVDIDVVIAKVKRSTFLRTEPNITLKSILGNCYKKMMRGEYEDREYLVRKQKSNFSTARDYTEEQYSALYHNVEDLMRELSDELKDKNDKNKDDKNKDD